MMSGVEIECEWLRVGGKVGRKLKLREGRRMKFDEGYL